MRESTMRTRWVSTAVVVGLAVAGCAGPSAPLDVGTQTAPLSLVLGELKAVDTAPIGPVPGPMFPTTRPYYQPPAGVPSLPPVIPLPPPQPCPEYDPVAPVLGVGRTVPAPPAKAPYRYRTQAIEAMPGTQTAWVGDATWTIEPQPVDSRTGAYDVVYTIKTGDVVTKRVLRTLPRDITAEEGGEPTDQTNPNQLISTANGYLSLAGVQLPASMPNMAGYGLAGIYLVSQETNKGAAFTPSTPIALLQLRQLTGATDPAGQQASAITSIGVDPVNQAVMAFRSTVTNPTHKVNACGTKLEAVEVTLSSPNSPTTAPPPNPGSAFAPDLGAALYAEKNPSADDTKPKANLLLFGQKLDFGLQWGGLLLADTTGVVPKGLLPSGLQIDPQDPPTATPSGPPPREPIEAAMWAGMPVLRWALAHSILKQTSATINQKPILPKAS